MGGIHLNAFTRQPFALIAAADDVERDVSHEVLEMLADPFGNRLIAAAHPNRPRGARALPARGVRSLPDGRYPVNGVQGLGLLHAALLRSGAQPRGVLQLHRRRSKVPLEILEGGYITWIDPRDSGLYQMQRR